MATNKKGLHASKRRSNSSPELQLQVTDIDSVECRLSLVVKTVDWSKCEDDSADALQCKLTSNHGDSSRSAKAAESVDIAPRSTDVSVQDQAKLCKSCGSTAGAEPNLGQSVRPKVKNFRFKTRTRHMKKPAADAIVMDIGEHSVNSSSSDADRTGEPSFKQQKRQGIGRVASSLVARLRHKGRKHQRRGSTTDSDSSTSAKDIKIESPRPRSKSFSGRIMRKFVTKEKTVSGKDSPCREVTSRRKRWPQSNRIQSCIDVVFTGKGAQKSKGKPAKNEQETRQPRRYTPVINLDEFNPDDYPIESEDDIQRVIREQEIREGVDPPPGYQPQFLAEVETHPEPDKKVTTYVKNGPKDGREEEKPAVVGAATAATGAATATGTVTAAAAAITASTSTANPVVGGSTHTTANIYDQYGSLTPEGTYIPRTVHTQIDYMHCLVPDQKSIMDNSFYWGKIDRFEADLLLENKPEGTFLLRDSAHDEFVFSVSFRRYGRTLHARIEQWKHKFSFDAHDPGVYASDTICGLLKHYKDPNFCMFFEPMLTTPLPRPNPPSLQELARATICSHTSYDGLTHLALPRTLKEYTREYHYKQRVRMRRFEVPEMPEVAEPKMGVITKTCISR